MTKLEYISKNCMQCAADLDECFCVVLGIHEFAHSISCNSPCVCEFTINGFRVLLPDHDLPGRLPPRIIASMYVTDHSDEQGEGLVIRVGEYGRFIPRSEFREMSLEDVCSEMFNSLKAHYPEVFHKIREINISPYFYSFVLGVVFSYIFYLFIR